MTSLSISYKFTGDYHKVSAKEVLIIKTLIKNGLLIDPKNKVHSYVDLLIEAGKVAQVIKPCPNEETEADIIIDASNKIVCPGFIDIHMHEDPVEEDGRIYADEEKAIFNCELRTGVTTVIGGQCGISTYDPIKYLDIVDKFGASVNVAMFAAHAYYRELYSKADKYSPVTDKELQDISNAIKEALAKGCLGVSYGIRYVPGLNEKEMRETAKHCQNTDKVISAHLRDDAKQIFKAAKEFIDIGNELNISTQISHIGSMAGFGQMQDFLAMIDSYNMNNAKIACDCYPYYAFSTSIGSTTYDEGWLERYNCDYSALELCEGKYKGQRCTKEIFEELRREHPTCITVAYVMQEEQIDMALRHPNVMLGSDGLMNKGQGHPRSSGSFARLLSKFALPKTDPKKTDPKKPEMKNKLSLYDAIAMMTQAPAEKLALANKGCLNVGADADIVIFDPALICDNATFEQPTLPPDGIDYVLINGEVALKQGKIVKNNLGRSIRN